MYSICWTSVLTVSLTLTVLVVVPQVNSCWGSTSTKLGGKYFEF